MCSDLARCVAVVYHIETSPSLKGIVGLALPQPWLVHVQGFMQGSICQSDMTLVHTVSDDKIRRRIAKGTGRCSNHEHEHLMPPVHEKIVIDTS